MVSESRYRRARKENPLVTFLPAQGVELVGRGNKRIGRCPFHEDRTPSLSVDLEKDLWHCFACNIGGSAVEFAMHRDRVGKAEAIHCLLRDAHDQDLARRVGPRIRRGAVAQQDGPPAVAVGVAEIPPSALPVPALAPAPFAVLRDVAEFYHGALPASALAMAYLARRGIDHVDLVKRFKVGFASGSLRPTIAPDSEQQKALRGVGILGPSGREHFAGCITVPIPDLAGAVVGMYGRSIEGTRHLYLPGPHCGVLNAEAAKVYDEVLLTEAIIDALSIYRAGLPNVIPCYGVHGFTELHARVLHEGKVRRVVVAFDGDQAGDAGAAKLAERLAALGIASARLVWPDGVKDANDFFTRDLGEGKKATKADFEQILAGAVPLRSPAVVVASSPAAGSTKPGEFEHLVSINDEEAIFAFTDLLYVVRGLERLARDSMRLVVEAEACGRKHTDRFDFYVARSRRAFAGALAARMELPRPRIEEDLLEIQGTLAEIHRRRRAEAERGTAAAAPPMTEEEERAARGLLEAPDLLDRVRAAYDELGYVGERVNKTLAYLVATSRKLRKPLSLMLRSSSGAGKSDLLEKTVEIMPPEEVESLSRLTPAALYYLKADHLRHKLLVIDEREGSEEADYSLRSLQSRRELTILVPVKDPAGRGLVTRRITVYGPAAVMESTTRDELNPENANRCFEAFLDESPEQTRRIHDAQRAYWEHCGRNGEAKRLQIRALLQNAQRLLQPVEVQIPFSRAIDFPAEWIRTRRDHERFVGLVAASAFLHQHRRRRLAGEPPVIAAALEDYRIAYGLARDLLANALTDLSVPLAAMLETVRRRVHAAAQGSRVAPRDVTFRRRDVREWTMLPDHQVKRAMRTLEDLEYIETSRLGRGASFRYRLLDITPAERRFAELTTPEDLTRRVGAEGSGPDAARA